MIYVGAILFVIAFGWLSRMAGGGWPKLPWGLDQHIYALPYAILGGILPHLAGLNGYYVAGFVLLSYLAAFLAKRTGHGQYFLPFSVKAIEAERLDFIVRLFFGRDPRVVPKNFNMEQLQRNITAYGEKKLYHRNLTGMFVTGIGVGLGAAISAAVSGYYVIVVLLLASTAAKALAYFIGYEVNKNPNMRTEIGEIFTGIFGGIGLALSAIWIWKKKK